MALSRLVKATRGSIKTILKTLGFYDKYTAEFSFQRGWVREFEQNKLKVLEYWKKYRFLDDINAICKITEDTKVLDVGCGISTVLHYVKGKKFGIDPLADEYLKLYGYPEGIVVERGFSERIPFPNECFDVVFCSNVLDHVTDTEKTIDEIHRVLKANGHFVLTVETFREMHACMQKTKRSLAHPHSLTKRDVYQLLGHRFKTILEMESPWIGLRAYVNGLRESHSKELIMVLEKA